MERSCKTHNKRFEYFCTEKDCQQKSRLCCPQCIIKNDAGHFGHNNIEIFNVNKQLRMENTKPPTLQQKSYHDMEKQMLKDLDNKIKDLLKDTQENIKKIKEKLQKKIKSSFDPLKAPLQFLQGSNDICCVLEKDYQDKVAVFLTEGLPQPKGSTNNDKQQNSGDSSVQDLGEFYKREFELPLRSLKNLANSINNAFYDTYKGQCKHIENLTIQKEDIKSNFVVSQFKNTSKLTLKRNDQIKFTSCNHSYEGTKLFYSESNKYLTCIDYNAKKTAFKQTFSQVITQILPLNSHFLLLGTEEGGIQLFGLDQKEDKSYYIGEVVPIIKEGECKQITNLVLLQEPFNLTEDNLKLQNSIQEFTVVVTSEDNHIVEAKIDLNKQEDKISIGTVYQVPSGKDGNIIAPNTVRPYTFSLKKKRYLKKEEKKAEEVEKKDENENQDKNKDNNNNGEAQMDIEYNEESEAKKENTTNAENVVSNEKKEEVKNGTQEKKQVQEKKEEKKKNYVYENVEQTCFIVGQSQYLYIYKQGHEEPVATQFFIEDEEENDNNIFCLELMEYYNYILIGNKNGWITVMKFSPEKMNLSFVTKLQIDSEKKATINKICNVGGGFVLLGDQSGSVIIQQIQEIYSLSNVKFLVRLKKQAEFQPHTDQIQNLVPTQNGLCITFSKDNTIKVYK